MSNFITKVFIFVHSFVRRFQEDLCKGRLQSHLRMCDEFVMRSSGGSRVSQNKL